MSTPQTWQIVIQKLLGTEYFVNDYHVQAISPNDAYIKGQAIAELEKEVHTTLVGFVNMRVREAGQSEQGTVYPLTGNGLVGVQNYYPLYCTARVDFACEVGRPGRKYLRLPLDTNSASQGLLNVPFRNFINTNYSSPMIALGYVCKPNGQLFIAAGVAPGVQMRQLRRGSKRRLQPII